MSSLELVTLGTGTAFPEAERGPTCHLLRCAESRIAVDLGSGALQKLCAWGASPLELDALLLTHAHLDHVADVIPLLFALHVPGYERARPLDVFASAGTLEILERVRTAWGRWLEVADSQVHFHALAVGDVRDLGPLRVEVGSVAHDATSIGYRFTSPSGRTLAIPGDSGPCDGLVELCRDADLAVLECSMPEGVPLEGHMSPSELADLALRSGVHHLALVHRYPAAIANDAVAAVRNRVAIPVSVPDDGCCYEIG